MATVTQPLRDEHKELMPHIESLRVAADAIGRASDEEVRRQLDTAYDFLAHHLIPHALAEDRALYPVVDRVLGAPGATATMSRDHVEVGRLTEELRALREEAGARGIDEARSMALRRVLYGLYALVHVHFAKEEEVYLPLLDAKLPADEARAMFEAMERAAGDAKAAAV